MQGDAQKMLLRIFVGESDKHHGRPLYQALVEELRRHKLAGATVLRGVMGFGANSVVHAAHLLELSLDLPMVVEAVDTEERIRALLPELKAMVGDGLITLERIEVVHYRGESGKQPG